jgi:hypothetical protein
MSLQVVKSVPVTVSASGKIKRRKNPADPLEQSIMMTPAGPLLRALDGRTKKKRKAKKKSYKAAKKRVAKKGTRKNPGKTSGASISTVTGGRSIATALERSEKERYRSNAKKKLSRFQKLERSIAARGGSYDPPAVAAAIGRRKYGKKKFQKMALAGKKRAAKKRKAAR